MSDNPTELGELSCESCGGQADVVLDDGSVWCISCDASARLLGYDNRPGTILGSTNA